MKELPLYFHPTEIVLVDDDVTYAKNLEIMMLNKGIPSRIFNDPKKAMEFLKNKPIPKLSDKIAYVEDESLEKTILNIDLNPLHQEIYNQNRFNEISTVIVDYAMPGLNGKEFFEQIKHIPVEKILLTGEESYETAVKMFNEGGLIDRFFRKSDENLFAKLFSEVADLKVHFFQSLSRPVLSALQKKSTLLPFNDPAFIQSFLEITQQNEIVEYYVLDEGGSYLLVNKAGAPMLLIVKSEEDMKMLYELAEGEKNVSKNILADLKNKKKLVYFLTEKDSYAPVNSWPLYDAKRLAGGAQTYYYALAKNAFEPEVQIYSYQQFLEHLGQA